MSDKPNESFLSLSNSENFRNFLTTKNLTPYKVQNGYSPYAGERYFEVSLNTFTPSDSKDLLESGREYGKLASLQNLYGGKDKIDAAESFNNRDGAVSMQQAGVGSVFSQTPEQAPNYSVSSAKLELVSEFFIGSAAVVNRYIPEGGFTESYISTDVIFPKEANVTEYPNYSVIDGKLESKIKNDGGINKYIPEGGYENTYQISLKVPDKQLGGGQQYPNIQELDKDSSKSFRNEAGAINQFKPEDGYTNKVSLNLNVKPKQEGGTNEYYSSTANEEQRIARLEEEFKINRYQPETGFYNLYSTALLSLSKLRTNGEYRNDSNPVREINAENQKAAASINKFKPQNGYNQELSLSLNVLPQDEKSENEYNGPTDGEEKIIENVKEEILINKYQPTGGLFNLYTNKVFSVPSQGIRGEEYTKNDRIFEQSTTFIQREISKVNKYKPATGYINGVQIQLVTVPAGYSQIGEYLGSNTTDKEIIDDTIDEITINRYKPAGGLFNLYTNNLLSLPPKPFVEEYGSILDGIVDTNKQNQTEAAKLNKFGPEEGFISKLSLQVLTSRDEEGFLGLYPNGILPQENLVPLTLQELAVNRYTEQNGLLRYYSDNTLFLTKLGGGSQQYSDSLNSILVNNVPFQNEALISNKYTPSDGSFSSVVFGLNPLLKDPLQPNEYIVSTIDSEDLLDFAKKEIVINRYIAQDGNLAFYSFRLQVLKRLYGQSQEYNGQNNELGQINDFLIDYYSQEELQDAAAINKYVPENGYFIRATQFINSLETLQKGTSTAIYSSSVDIITGVSQEYQEVAEVVNKFIPPDGYNNQYTNKKIILPKGDDLQYGAESLGELLPEFSPILNQGLLTQTGLLVQPVAVVNRYTPNDGFSLKYEGITEVLEKVPNTIREYPNFIIPDDILFGGVNVNVEALLKNKTDILINPQESYLQQLSIRFLSNSFRERIQREVQRQTIGRVNLNAFSDPFSISLLLSGKDPLVYKNYAITVPDGVFDQAANLIQRFSGTYIPVSPIEGEYFSSYPPKEQTLVGGAIQSVLSFFTNPATPSNRSIKFLNNTGSGQKSVLFDNLENNIYRPLYEKNRTQIGSAIDNFLDAVGNPLGLGDNNIGRLYIPSITEDVENLSPPTSVDQLGVIFEGTELDNYNFGLRSLSYDDDRDPTGGFSWTQASVINSAGKFVGENGAQGPLSPTYQGTVQDKLNAGRSDKISFRDRSILKRTQDLIDSAPVSGAKRLVHVGNAINQTSKVFSDGYKEMTKGSKIKKYVTKNGAEVGEEYGRVFTKDIPYLTYGNLQTTVANDSGLETNGNIRKFTNSIVDSTYNLNIVPTTGPDSTNIKDGQVKKYMFSIENLAWKGSDEYNNLPECEKGPNGGRIMWFPPYGLEVGAETSQPTFNPVSFLGRPEPIFTYESTKRTGSISWQIIVDHPSVTDIVVKYELARAEGSVVTQVMNSFFAGLKKYDIYELARKYNTIDLGTINDVYQSILQSNQVDQETKSEVLSNIPPENQPQQEPLPDLKNDFAGYAFYFPIELDGSNQNYNDIYDEYITESPTYTQIEANFPIFAEVFLTPNYNELTDLIDSVSNLLQENKTRITISLKKTKKIGASNSSDWEQSIEKFFYESSVQNKTFNDYKNKTFILKFESTEIETTVPQRPTDVGIEKTDAVSCIEGGDDPVIKWSIDAAFCRSYVITDIVVEPYVNPINPTDNNNSNPNPDSLFGQRPQPQQPDFGASTSASKKIIRKLLTESNYFEVLKKEQSFIYDSIKTKFKFFDRAFHSITPEGLNSRLVFLQQCVRPGKTIPVKQEDGSSSVTDSFNTNFGSPPVLILRLGDFYNTKIIPQSLTINYENIWDFNPEGIGFQPMIAKVQLSFDMIGGHGLKNPVEQLQNALSFNFYANTEMYDERAVATEDTTAIDSALIAAIRNEEPLPVINNTENVASDLGATFGEIIESTPSENGLQTGVLQYKKFFNEFVTLASTYFTGAINSYESILNQYNKGIWGQLVHQRNFDTGTYQNLQTPITANLLGKPSYTYQDALSNLANQYIDDAQNNQDRLLGQIDTVTSTGLLTNIVRTKIANNYYTYISRTANAGFISLSENIETLASNQLALTKYMEKLDFISFSGDAKVLNDGSSKFYFLTGQTENGQNTLEQFKSDYAVVMNDLTAFTSNVQGVLILPSNLTSGDFSIFDPSGPNMGYTDDYAFTLFSHIILNNKQLFIDELVKDVDIVYYETAKTVIKNFLDDNWIPTFQTELSKEKSDFDTFKQTPNIQNNLNYNPQVNGTSITTRDRKTNFSTSGNSAPYEQPFQNIKSTQNTNNDIITFNGKKVYYG
jgi:hypothetical protein